MQSFKHFFAVCFIALLATDLSSVVPGFDLLVSTAEAEPYGSLSAQEIIEQARQQERERCQNEGGRYYDGQCNKDQNDVYIIAKPDSDTDGGMVDWSQQGGGYEKTTLICPRCGKKYYAGTDHWCIAHGYLGDTDDPLYDHPDDDDDD